MNLLRALRKRRRPLTARILAMLGVVWLNMVLQPCVMAAQTDMSMPGPCPHCPAPMSEDCDGVPANVCTYFDQVDYDGRIPHPKIIKKVDYGFVAVAALPAAHLHSASACATGPPPDTELRLPAVPINVLHCVYLN